MNQPSSSPLSGMRVMVTRPAHQALQLITLLEEAGASVLCQPLIEIEAIPNPASALEHIKTLAQTDIVIFISQNAVTHGIKLIERYGRLPANLKLATIGLGSATLLEKLTNHAVEIMPVAQYNSEGLLAHPELQKVKDKVIIIFRGIGGRSLLADTLRERGAKVEYAEVYRRQPPKIDLEQLAATWQSQAIDTICITSGEGLENLILNISKKSATAQLRADILNCQLVIVNKRLNSVIQKNGFTKPPILVEKVSDKAIVDAIINNYR